MALAVLLLSDVSIQPTYTEVYQSPVVDAGLSPINTSLSESYHFNEYSIIEFMWYYNTIFSDTRNVRAVEPVSCSQGAGCKSYFMPGTPAKIIPVRSLPQATNGNFTNAISFIQHDAPGYQLDFSPIERDCPPMYSRDCRLYGTSSNAIQLCLKCVNASFMAGTPNPSNLLTVAWNACPESAQKKQSCLNTTDWQLAALINTNMTIYERRATTIFDRSNLTIVDILEISNPTPTSYTPDDFFVFYDIIFSVNETEPYYNLTSQYLLIEIIVSSLNQIGKNPFDIGEVGGVAKLQELLAAIPLIFNSMYWQFPFDSNVNMGKSIAFAIPSYRVPHLCDVAYD